ncbi:MAG: PhzF family phenazine biosynthesis protein [Gammaproteobacteria bacterium]|jgi:PhzF family phenazine biosynthesis protein
MKLKIYQIDAFADRLFEGNPAAVCPLDKWLPDDMMQAIAAENNLSETAFFVPLDDGFHIRWFTPVHEVNLCGHATLAGAYVLFHFMDYQQREVRFQSKSGLLTVKRDDDWLALDFPAQPPEPCAVPEAIKDAFESPPVECLRAEDYVVVYESEADVRHAQPDMASLAKLDLRGVAITARGDEHDFVCRFFAPRFGIDEDPVTGSAYTQLVPYWARVLNKREFRARQLSRRGGEVRSTLNGDRVTISGKARKYLEGMIDI